MTKISYHCMHNLIEQYILNVTNAPVTSTMIFNISFLTHYVIRLPLFQESKQKSIRKSHWNHFQILAFKNISFSYTSVSLNGSKVNRGQISSLCHTEAIRNVILLCSVMYSASECLPPEEQTHVQYHYPRKLFRLTAALMKNCTDSVRSGDEWLAEEMLDCLG